MLGQPSSRLSLQEGGQAWAPRGALSQRQSACLGSTLSPSTVGPGRLRGAGVRAGVTSSGHPGLAGPPSGRLGFGGELVTVAGEPKAMVGPLGILCMRPGRAELRMEESGVGEVDTS